MQVIFIDRIIFQIVSAFAKTDGPCELYETKGINVNKLNLFGRKLRPENVERKFTTGNSWVFINSKGTINIMDEEKKRS
jgi:hypothetical protein